MKVKVSRVEEEYTRETKSEAIKKSTEFRPAVTTDAQSDGV